MDIDTILWFLLRFVIFLLVAGPAALMGNAIAETWRPWWQNVAYGALLAVGIQFLGFALFQGPFVIDSLVSSDAQPLGYAVVHYLVTAVFISAVSLMAYRITLARKMVSQYPWLYERASLLTWRARNEG
ncbi:MAG TPA: hypothetical protein VGF43_06870 [Dongiaceae bacterium]|jgi:hypothetical protein